MRNKAHIKIDKVVGYCSECPFCSIKCTGYGKSGCYEYNLICHGDGVIRTEIVYTNLRLVDIFAKSDSEKAKDLVPDDCPMKIEEETTDPSELKLKMDRFYEEHCRACGTQRCLGVYDEEWREGCKLFKGEFKDDVFL